MATTPYFDAIQLIERLHRHYLDVLKLEIERKGIQDINSVQSMILYNIGDDDLTVGELTIRGYYQGSNVSYNVKELVTNGYLIRERSVHDKRSIRVKLSDKGRELRDLVAGMLNRHEKLIVGTELTPDKVNTALATLRVIERFWTGQTNFSGRVAEG